MTVATVEFETLRRLIQCQRLVRLARNPTHVESIRAAGRRIGLRPGARVVDVGCGPLGALLTLAAVVGPTGRVVGLDRRADVLQIARQNLQREGLDRVELIQADVNVTTAADLGLAGQFDAAFCRLVLINQREPLTTLRHIAALVRPGGHVVVQELLDDLSYPSFDPPVPAFGRFFELFQESMRCQGKRLDIARHFRALAEDAGLRELSHQTLFDVNPANAPEFIQEQGLGMLLVFTPSLLSFGLATRDEIDELARQLKAASNRTYTAFRSWAFGELIAQVR